MSERIESVRFSPDGNRLLVTGGRPARTGEVQVWDVEERELILSLPITYDTVYGGSWSPDGKLIAFGCADNTVRAINAVSGEQVLFQGAHSDWVLDTHFSKEGTHLVSVSRDMTTKLTEVATQRFVDNVTSITPKVLKGGISAVARHPDRDEIVIGGSDGEPKVYRMFRKTKRVIGDDANLIRRLPSMPGRIFSVAVSADGKRIAAASSLDGAGHVAVHGYEFDTSMPDDIKKINEMVVTSRNAEQKQKLDQYHRQGVTEISRTEISESGIYALAFHPQGNVLAAAGADGSVRLINPNDGSIVDQFSPAPVQAAEGLDNERPLTTASLSGTESNPAAPLPNGTKIEELQINPAAVQLKGRFDYVQLVALAKLSSGDSIDVTRMAKLQLSTDVATVTPHGTLLPQADGSAELQVSLGDHRATVPVRVTETAAFAPANYVRDVAPVMSRLGCNAGTCHGAAKGKNGFKLSLRGYDALFDVRALTDDLASRRVNIASPDQSLMLLKTSGAAPHVGGQLTVPGHPYYEIIRSWINDGAPLDLSTPRVTQVEVFPANPVIQELGAQQQVRIVATYSDGNSRDVTREAFVESGDTETATASVGGLLTAVRRGEASILVRYEGSYAATTLTVMGNRSGFVWNDSPAHNPIDEFTSAKWKRMKIQASPLCSDTEFLRRVYLDLTGLPPTSEQIRDFLADARDSQIKRDELVDRLIGNEDFVDYWTNKWADLLQVNRKYLGAESAAAFRNWIRNEVANNTPYDQFARKILTASGSNKDNPAASYYKILRDPLETMENTTHLFLAVRFNCNKCHDHPFERWTQDQYYETAAYFARVGLKKDPTSGDKRIGGTAVEGAKPLYEVVFEKEQGEVLHERTGQVSQPQFPYRCDYEVSPNASRREQLAAWITSADNQYFAKSYVNRLWGYLMGVGIIEPIDDIRAGNRPSNPELLDYLTQEFVDCQFNVRHIMQLICKSRTYQLSIETNPWNQDDATNYSHAIARRLPAEVVFDAVHRVTGAKSKIPGVPVGTRAAALPDAGVKLPSGFLANLGRPPRESSCECERTNGLQLGSVMALISGPTVASAIGDAENTIASLVRSETDDERLINELALRVLNRPATRHEIQAVEQSMEMIEDDHQMLVREFKKRQQYVEQMTPIWEEQRLARIANTKATLKAYRQEIAARVQDQEQKRQERIAQRERELKEYQAQLPQKVEAWSQKHNSAVEWFPLEPIEATASSGDKIWREADRSLRVEGAGGKGNYTITYRTNLRRIAGVRLEALPIAEQKGNGPGLSDNGNFVLTELELALSPRENEGELQPTKLSNPVADFTQPGFDIKRTINGRTNDQQGWAISPSTGVVHWGTYELETPAEQDSGFQLRFTIHQNHNAGKHRLGRFRLSVTSDPKPLGLSLPEELKAIVSRSSDARTDEQKARLTSYFQSVDGNHQAKQKALAEAKKPLPVDPKLKQLEDRLAKLSKPLAKDRLLTRLETDVKMSESQLANKRLTAAQDYAWAMINSPAFLFNH